MPRRKAGAGSMATTSCPSSFKVSGSPTGSKSPPPPRPRNPKPPPPDPSGHHQDSAIARQHRVIVNLDTLEYIDPVKFGQAPTLAGMVSSAPKDRDLPILKKAAKEWRQQIVAVACGLFVIL